MPSNNNRFRARVFVYGMTYPEISSKNIETVCTAGVFEDGSPVRLYPIAHRYLEGDQRFHKYQWIELDLVKHPEDRRPESYLVYSDTIEAQERVPSKNDGWEARASILFQKRDWQFDSMERLNEAHSRSQISLAVMKPTEIVDVVERERDPDDELKFFEKLRKLELRKEISDSQFALFEKSVFPEIKDLHFPKLRLRVHWRCSDTKCGTEEHTIHKMQVLDWEAAELQRKLGINKAKEALLNITDPEMYDVRFFLGSLFTHPNRFMIGGLWYPRLVANPSMFSPQYLSDVP
jgi:hypothetical protein